MLPEKLSNGLCSLNPDQERLSMVCDMLVTAEGAVHAYQFYPAVILSHARFTYTEVAAILSNTRGPEAQRRQKQVPDLVPHLLDLHEVYRALLKARAQRGAVDFETTETQIVCDENGRIDRIVPRVRTEAHRLIEEAMLAANVCAADFIIWGKHASLYRVHEGPTAEKRQTLQNYLRSMGIGLTVSDEPTPAELQAIAQQTRDRPDAAQIHAMLLRSMQQALYTPINSGHFGLAFEAYTHFTSPIRRYPDLLVHRTIKAILNGRHYTLQPPEGVATAPLSPRMRRPMAQALKRGQENDAWEQAGLHCSANERRADEASRDVEAWLKCKFMRERLGEEYSGTVTAATSFGLFVQLDALYVEGLIHISELGGEYYRFDEQRQELRGERTGVRYAIGTKVRVQVIRVDLDGRKIDFRMLRDGEEGGPVRKSAPTRSGGEAQTGAEQELAAIKQTDRDAKRSARQHRQGAAGAARKGGGGGAAQKHGSGKKTRRARR
jgi:ribonuclease R